MADENNRPMVLPASELTGNQVVNLQGDDLGKIEEIVIDLGYGNIAYAVLSFGGVLGLGDKLFAIPWQALSLDTDQNRFILDIDKDQLKTAQGFDKDDWPDMADYTWAQGIYDYYNCPPYWTK